MAVLVLAPALTSCRLFRKAKPVPPPAAAPIQIKPAPVKTPPPPVLEAPPEIPQSAEDNPPIELPGAEQQPLPPPARQETSFAGGTARAGARGDCPSRSGRSRTLTATAAHIYSRGAAGTGTRGG